jgi:phage recombination protein Bet
MQQALYPGARRESVEMVLGYCQARGLDPMLKPVHIVPMWVDGGMRDVPLPGIALYRIQAARSGQYGGKTEPEFGPDVTRTFTGTDRQNKPVTKTVTFPSWCRVTVKRGGADFSAKEFWTENYATAGRNSEVPNEMWAKRPYAQLAKCAEAQALRMAFPELTGGEPTSEEMEGKSFAPLPPTHGPTISGHAERAPEPDVCLTMLTPGGETRDAPNIGTWVRWCEAAIAKLEDAAAVAAWMNAMDQHLTTAETVDASAVAHITRIANDRIMHTEGEPA